MVQSAPGVSRCSARQYLVQMVQGAPGVSGSRCSVRQGSRSKLQAVQVSSQGYIQCRVHKVLSSQRFNGYSLTSV